MLEIYKIRDYNITVVKKSKQKESLNSWGGESYDSISCGLHYPFVNRSCKQHSCYDYF